MSGLTVDSAGNGHRGPGAGGGQFAGKVNSHPSGELRDADETLTAFQLRQRLNDAIDAGNDRGPGVERDRLRSEADALEAVLDRLLSEQDEADRAAWHDPSTQSCLSVKPNTLGYGRCRRPAEHGDEHRGRDGDAWID